MFVSSYFWFNNKTELKDSNYYLTYSRLSGFIQCVVKFYSTVVSLKAGKVVVLPASDIYLIYYRG